MCACEQPGQCQCADASLTAWAEAVVRQHRARLLRVARHEGLGPEDALDCAQEAFVTFLLRKDAHALAQRPDESGMVLTTMCRNAARNRRRRHHLRLPHGSDALEVLPASVLDGEGHLLAQEEHQRLKACVAGLGELQRRVVTLRMLQERPGEDVAQLLGVSSNHVAVLLLRAKEQLRVCMAPAEQT
jgi:RNA polymerase sigma-70 factor (ECF subfamily)